jgi:hypothetical protein
VKKLTNVNHGCLKEEPLAFHSEDSHVEKMFHLPQKMLCFYPSSCVTMTTCRSFIQKAGTKMHYWVKKNGSKVFPIAEMARVEVTNVSRSADTNPV